MIGQVDESGRALLELQVRRSEDDKPQSLWAWIDTAFTGDLVVPRAMIEQLDLPQSAAVMARLADGSQVVLETYQCVVDWFGDDRLIEVIENDGQFALLGTGMLMDRRIEIDCRTKGIVID